MPPSEHYAVDGDAAGVAAYTTASISDTVPCGAHRKNWGALEHDYTQADRYEQALTQAIIGEVCRPCPALEECAIWARLDRYTGFAGGTWYQAGRRARPPKPSKRAVTPRS